MQKVQKDQQTGEMQLAHSRQTDSHVIISFFPLSFLSSFCFPFTFTHYAPHPFPRLYPLLLLPPHLAPSVFLLSACLLLTSPRGK